MQDFQINASLLSGLTNFNMCDKTFNYRIFDIFRKSFTNLFKEHKMKPIFTNALLLASVFLLACTSAKTNIPTESSNLNTSTETSASGTAGETAQTNTTTEPIQTAVSPESVVTDLYKQHDAKKSPFFQNKSRALVDKYFAKSTAEMIWKDATRPAQNEIGALGADPLYDGQDFEIKKFAVGKAEIKDKTAVVPVTFENFGEKKKIVFEMISSGRNWKIQDIKYPAGYTLTGLFKENEKPAETESLRGEFEGKYQVGTTFCTVTPVKMAFEVRWAKGSGKEMFFFKDNIDGQPVFSSDSDPAKENRFVFDDENYNRGKFIRADGKELSVKRAN